jgi:hypothetical protein
MISKITIESCTIIGYSDGHLRGDDDSFVSGGQCEGGLKMIITIGETPLDNKHGGNSTSYHDPDPFTTPPAQLPGI